MGESTARQITNTHTKKTTIMAITFQKTTYYGRTPEIWRGECKMLPGGFTPANTIPTGKTINRGTLLAVNFPDHTAAVIKTATILTGGTTTKARVDKGHLFAVGDRVMKSGKTDASPAISSIDTSNTDYDILNLSAAISGLTAGDIIVESTEYTAADSASNTAAVPAAPKYVPNAICGAEKTIEGNGLNTIDAAYEAVVLTPSLGFPVLTEWLNGFCLAANPNIIFIHQ